MNVKEVKEILRSKAGIDVSLNENAITCTPENLRKVAQALQATPGLELGWLEGIFCHRKSQKNGAVWKLSYLLRSVAHGRTLLGSGLSLVVEIPESDESGTLPTVQDIWPMAQWMERDASAWSGLEFL